MKIASDILLGLIVFVGVFYGFAVWRFMRHRLRAARPLSNGRLALAKGSTASAGRKLWGLVICAALAALLGVRDILSALNDPEPFEVASFTLRLLFIAFVILIVDSFRLDKKTYINGISQLSRDTERDEARDIERDIGRDVARDPARDVNRDIGRDPARDTDRDEGRDTYRDSQRDEGRDEAADSRERDADLREQQADRREVKADQRQGSADWREGVADWREGEADQRERDADKREREE